SRAGADVLAENKTDFRYPSHVEQILGPMCFDYGFGPFRWVCTSGDPNYLKTSDRIAMDVLNELAATASPEIEQQMRDNIRWIKEADANRLVVGSQARILYADAAGRIAIALAFNRAVNQGVIQGPIVLGRDHHDVSGTDSPYRETSHIEDGSNFTADMSIHNVIGGGCRGATWVSIHNGGGVGWGEAITGGFGLLIDGSEEAAQRAEDLLFFDVNNGIARRAWGRSAGARDTITREAARSSLLEVTPAMEVKDDIIDDLFKERNGT